MHRPGGESLDSSVSGGGDGKGISVANFGLLSSFDDTTQQPSAEHQQGLLRSLLQNNSCAMLCSALLAAVLMASIMIPVLSTLSVTPSAVLVNGTFVLTTYHSVRDVVALNESSAALVPLLGDAGHVGQLRAVLLAADGSLLIAQSSTEDSRVLRLPNACVGGRPQVLVSRGLAHPYGLALMNGTLFVTNQRTSSVTWYNATSGSRLGSNNGLFAKVGSPRGIAASPLTSRVYVNSRTENLLIEFDANTGARLRTMQIDRPIGLLLLSNSPLKSVNGQVLFVGSFGSSKGSVMIVDVANWKVVDTLYHAKMSHPAGIAWLPPDSRQLQQPQQDQLLVFSQESQLILSWKLENGILTNATIWRSNLLYRPEALEVVKC